MRSRPRNNPWLENSQARHPGPAPAARPFAGRRVGPRPVTGLRRLPKIGPTADRADHPVIAEQAPVAGRAEMAAIRRGLSHATTREKRQGALTLRTILPPNAAGRGRVACNAQYIKPGLAPPLPACARAPAADVGSGDRCRLPFLRTLVLARRSLAARREFRRQEREPPLLAAAFKRSEKPRECWRRAAVQ